MCTLPTALPPVLSTLQNKRYDVEPTAERLHRDADGLFNAGQGKLGTDENTFISVLTNCSPRCGETLRTL